MAEPQPDKQEKYAELINRERQVHMREEAVKEEQERLINERNEGLQGKREKLVNERSAPVEAKREGMVTERGETPETSREEMSRQMKETQPSREAREVVREGPWQKVTSMARAAEAVPVSHISWSSIFAGLIIAIIAQIILSAIGGFIGITIGTSRTLTISLGLWTGFSALVSLILGGFVSSRMAAVGGTVTGIIHGILTWALFFITAVALATIGAAAIFGILTPNLLVTQGQIAVATGYALLGMGLSLAAAVIGGIIGSNLRRNEMDNQRIRR